MSNCLHVSQFEFELGLSPSWSAPADLYISCLTIALLLPSIPPVVSDRSPVVQNYLLEARQTRDTQQQIAQVMEEIIKLQALQSKHKVGFVEHATCHLMRKYSWLLNYMFLSGSLLYCPAKVVRELFRMHQESIGIVEVGSHSFPGLYNRLGVPGGKLSDRGRS